MRMFVGIPLPPNTTMELAYAMNNISLPVEAFRRTRAENWHITLQFLGSATAAQMDCLVPRLAAISIPPIRVRIVEIGFLGHAIVAGLVRDTPVLGQLAEQIMAASISCGLPPEDRPFRPHITLARRKGRANHKRPPHNRELLKVRSKVDCEFLAEEFMLYESFPQAQGSRYETRARFPLRKP